MKSAAMKAQHSQEKTNWITPNRYLDLVRQVFRGAIDLDVASDERANAVVKAKRFYTEADDGLLQSWYGKNVYCNPPGSGKPGVSTALAWLNHMKADHEVCFVQGIFCAFTMNTASIWYQRYIGLYPICHVDHRIRFLRDDYTPADSPTQANGFIYFGKDEALFAHVFGEVGQVVPAYRRKG